MGIAAGISAIGSLGSSFMTSNAASSAANTEAQASQEAMALQQAQYQQTRHDLLPYRAAGKGATNQLTQQLPQLSSQFDPTEASLEATPGYQFDLSQGLKSTQNSAAARGLGVSGAALKGASTFATGLADNTLQTQFNIDQQNKQNAYNKLSGVANMGENAAAQTGTIGASLANSSANSLMQGAQGQASAALTQGTAFNPLLQGLGSYYTTSNLGLGTNPVTGGSMLNFTGAGNNLLSGIGNNIKSAVF